MKENLYVFLQFLFIFLALCYKMYLGYLNKQEMGTFSALLTVSCCAAFQGENIFLEVIAHDFQSDFTEHH